jgi:hypothetical protein
MSALRLKSHGPIKLEAGSASAIEIKGPFSFTDSNNANLAAVAGLSFSDDTYVIGSVAGVPVARAMPNISAGSGISVSAGVVAIDEAYTAKVSDLSSATDRISTLEGATSSYALGSDLSSATDRISTLEGATASYALSADLSNYAVASDLSSLDGRVSTLEGAGYAVASDVASTYAVKSNAELAGTLQLVGSGGTEKKWLVGNMLNAIMSADVLSVPISGKTCLIEVSAQLLGDAGKGYVKYAGLWYQAGSADCALVADSDSTEAYAAANGSELEVIADGANGVKVHINGNSAVGSGVFSCRVIAYYNV